MMDFLLVAGWSGGGVGGTNEKGDRFHARNDVEGNAKDKERRHDDRHFRHRTDICPDKSAENAEN